MSSASKPHGTPWAFLFVVLMLLGAISWVVAACDDTGPSPVGDHPDDSGTEDTGSPATADAADEGGEGGEDTDAEPTDDGGDGGSSTPDADATTPIQDAQADG